MYRFHNNLRVGSRILVPLAFFLLCNISYSQNHLYKDTITRIQTDSFVQFRDSLSFFPGDSLKQSPLSLIPQGLSLKNKEILFFDSLKVKASKNALTRKLYDFLIVTPHNIDRKRITAPSDAGYKAHSGMRIRSIKVQKVNVFGGNINNPSLSDPKKIEDVLNRTHFNTTEKIIRNNLLFAVNDTISPLTLSDNERILRQLPFINEARIIVIPVSAYEADIMVLTKDVYSLGGDFSFQGFKKGSISVFDKNIFGIGHEIGFEIPYDAEKINSPGFGVNYVIDNIGKSFLTLKINYMNGLGERTYGFNLSRKLVSSETKYAGGISVIQMYTSEDLDTMILPEPLKYNFQDYWLSRSFLLNRESVSRFIIGARYTNNNIFDRPLIFPDSYYNLQKYRLFLASAAFSIQKFYKTNLIYGYGRTEDIPYGGLFKVTVGKELNEFKKRTYIGTEVSFGKSSRDLGYFYGSAGVGTYFNESETEQGLLALKLKYFSNLMHAGTHMIRAFIDIDYSRGFDRYTDELLFFKNENGFSGFRNDSINGTQRLSVSLETVLFSPVNIYGFRFAFFGFTDFSFLSGSKQMIIDRNSLSGLGLGIRIRNDNMVFNTIQFRFTFFPDPPPFSNINPISVSGEQLLKPTNFESGPPSIIQYR